MQPETTITYDPRGLLYCRKCGVMLAYRTLREADRFVAKHRWGHRFMVLRARQPGWRQFGKSRSRNLAPNFLWRKVA